MIGPHEGQELQLMLEGKKCLAAFGDVIPEDGNISENIIPEQAFKPYIQNGNILRFEQDVPMKNGAIMRYVCFTLPNEDWRAKAYIFIRKKLNSQKIDCTDSVDCLIGYLLDYSHEDIEHFINKL